MATDYDCWKESEDAVSVQEVIANLNANSSAAETLLLAVLPKLEAAMDSGSFKAAKALQGINKFSVITSGPKRNPETLKKLDYILPGYFN